MATAAKPERSSGDQSLAPTRKSSWGDLIALAAASGLIVAFMYLAPSGGLPDARRLLLALGITIAFAGLAWFARGVNLTGALAGSAIAFVFAARDMRMFWVLLVVFAITLLATRFGSDRKQQLRTAEPKGGRSASQVLANLGAAGVATALAPAAWPVLALSALAEAAADTASSEIGMAFPSRTVLITSWRAVSPGIDGGMSLRGTLAAAAAASAIAATGGAFRFATLRQSAIIAGAGFLGTLVDSLLGALFERRGWLNNDLVNLISTAAAAGMAWVLL